MTRKDKIIVTSESPLKTEGELLKEQAGKGFGTATTVKVSDSQSVQSKTEESDEAASEANKTLAAVLDVVNQLKADIDAQKAEQLRKEQEAQDAIAELQRQQQLQLDEASNKAQQDLEAKQAEINSALAQKAEAEKRNASLEGLMKLTGNQHPVKDAQGSTDGGSPMINTLSSTSNAPQGIYAELQSIIDKAPEVQKFSNGGAPFLSRDNRELNHRVRVARESAKEWNQLLFDLETSAKRNGLLRGPSTKMVDKNAATVGGDIDGGFLTTLSAIMRTSHRPQYIFHNLADTRIDFAQGQGETIKIPRAAYMSRPADPETFKLSGSGTYTQIDATNRRIQTGTVSAVIEEWGLGKDSSNPAVSLPSFVQAYSMIDLLQVLETNLGDSYYYFEDLKIRSLLDPTSRVVYNDGDELTTTASNADGGITLQFLNNLFAYMRGLQIPTYRDGKYLLVMVDTAFAQFQNEMISDNIWQASTPTDLVQLANMVGVSTGQESGPADFASAYKGSYGGFHILCTNAYGMGAPGTAGVQTETVAAGSATTRSNYAMGANTIGRGIATEMEIRRDINDDFGRVGRYIWRSEEGFVAIDVDPTGYNDTSEVPQQLRVLNVRSIG